jgi:UDP-glucose 4-epimerase
MTEDLVPQPEDPYGIAKYAVELDLKAAHEMFGLDYVIIRPHNVYGEYQNIADRYRNVVGIFMNQTLRGEPMPIFGDGLQTRAFSYIGDVASVIAEAATTDECYGETFNIGADQPTTVLDLAGMVAHALGAPLKVLHHPPRNEVVHAYASHDKLHKVWPKEIPQTPLAEGIRHMADWVRELGPRPPIQFRGEIEVKENLPSAWTNKE